MVLPTSGFVVRIRWSGDPQSAPHITLQNVSTREVLTLNRWSDLLEALQKSPEPILVDKLD